MSDEGAVDRLKKKLYSREGAPEVNADARTPLSVPPAHSGRTWNPSGGASVGAEVKTNTLVEKLSTPPLNAMADYPRKQRNLAAWFLWGSLAFFVLAAGIAGYTFFAGNNLVSPKNIDIQIVAPSLIDSGKVSNLQFVIHNSNSVELLNADLIIEYPEGARSPDGVTLTRDRQTIGSIPSGKQVKLTGSAVFFGAEGAQQKVKASLEYQIAGSNAIFTKSSDATITIGSSPLSLSVSAPEEAIAGQPFTMDVTVQSNAQSTLSDVTVEAQYPFGFSLSSSNPKAAPGGALWRLGALDPGQSRVIRLTGTLEGQDGDERVFRFLIGSESDQTAAHVKVPLLTVPQSVTLHKPFVSATIAVDGQTGKTIPQPLGKSLQGSIAWKNNSADSVTNLTLTLSLRGTALDPNSVSAGNGFYDSGNSVIIWNKDQLPELASVAPGASGTLQFAFATKAPGAGTTGGSDIALNLQVRATRAGVGNVPEEVSSAASTRVVLASAINITSQATHFSGAFSNVGPMPPVVGRETQYAITWSVKNSSNVISNAQVSASLPPYMKFEGASAGSSVTFDSASRTVTWNIGELKAGTGYGAGPLTAAFQVSLTPSVSQVGQAPPLLGAATLSGVDRFAQANVKTTAPAVTTRLTADTGYAPGMDVVVAQ